MNKGAVRGTGVAALKSEGVSLPSRSTLNLSGPGIQTVDGQGRTDATVYGYWEQPITVTSAVFSAHIYSSTAYATINDMRYSRLWLRGGTVFKGLITKASVADATCTLRVGVYTDVLTPYALIPETEISRTLASTATTTTLFASRWTVPASGFYWFGVIMDGGAGAPAMFTGNLFPPTGYTPGPQIPVKSGAAQRDVFYTGGGALPATAAPTTASTDPTLIPIVTMVVP